MRDLINLLESVGLANRKPGDRFENDEGTVLVFDNLEFYPESGGFATPQELQQAIDGFARQVGTTPEMIQWTNDPKGAAGFGIATFADESGRNYYLGRYYRKISPNRHENQFPNLLPGGFKLQSKTAKKESAGYKPSDILTKFDNLTPNDIYKQVAAKFGADSDEARSIQLFIQGDMPLTIPAGNLNFEAFTNYFGELLQPMALVLGKNITGNAQEAELRFLDRQGFTTCTISFNQGVSGGLTDSTVTNPQGRSIGISTKAKGGAKASAKNLGDKIKEMQESPDGQKLLDQYKKEVALINIIVDNGYINAPLNLAMLYKMIDAEEAQQVKELKGLGPNDDVSRALSKNLMSMYNSRTAADMSKIVPFYHMLACIAYRVADYVNENTNFGEAASVILNFGAFMQAYTFASKKGSDIVLKPFEFEYPSKAVTKVLLSAGKTYFSTGNKGNFTFKILKNGAAEDEVDTDEIDDKPAPKAAKTDVSSLDKVASQRANVTARARGADTSSDVSSLGRKRRT